MYMCICSYLPILNTLTRIFIPIPPSLNTNSSIFVACHFPRKFWFQDHILCSNFLIPMYLSCPSLLKYRPLSHSNQRDNPLFLHANFCKLILPFCNISNNQFIYMQVQMTCIHAMHLTLKQYYIITFVIEYSPYIFKIFRYTCSFMVFLVELKFWTFFQIQTAL